MTTEVDARTERRMRVVALMSVLLFAGLPLLAAGWLDGSGPRLAWYVGAVLGLTAVTAAVQVALYRRRER